MLRWKEKRLITFRETFSPEDLIFLKGLLAGNLGSRFIFRYFTFEYTVGLVENSISSVLFGFMGGLSYTSHAHFSQRALHDCIQRQTSPRPTSPSCWHASPPSPLPCPISTTPKGWYRAEASICSQLWSPGDELFWGRKFRRPWLLQAKQGKQNSASADLQSEAESFT